jgi:hypothetical protein
MAENKPEDFRIGKFYRFVDKAIPSPPGTRSKGQHLLPGEDPWVMSRRWWIVTVATTVAALGAGLLIGRFLLP